jgi:hypothetical protein
MLRRKPGDGHRERQRPRGIREVPARPLSKVRTTGVMSDAVVPSITSPHYNAAHDPPTKVGRERRGIGMSYEVMLRTTERDPRDVLLPQSPLSRGE